MKFRVLQGNYIAGERGNRITYKAGDIVETDKDLLRIKDKFELVEEQKTPKESRVESAETNKVEQGGISNGEAVKTNSKTKRTR